MQMVQEREKEERRVEKGFSKSSSCDPAVLLKACASSKGQITRSSLPDVSGEGSECTGSGSPGEAPRRLCIAGFHSSRQRVFLFPSSGHICP